MSVLLALPRSIPMYLPTTNHDHVADSQSNKQRVERPPTSRTAKSPRLLRRALGGRVARPRATPSLSLSLQKQQILRESATGRSCHPEGVDPSPEALQSLQYITPQSHCASPTPSLASSSSSLETLTAVVTPVISAETSIDPQGLLRYVQAPHITPHRSKSAE